MENTYLKIMAILKETPDIHAQTLRIKIEDIIFVDLKIIDELLSRKELLKLDILINNICLKCGQFLSGKITEIALKEEILRTLENIKKGLNL